MIELCNVTKRYQMNNYRVKTVLDNVSYAFQEGVSIGVLGLNGAGKSTLMRIICGSEKPDTGYVRRTSRVSWPIGFTGALHGNLTGRENMRFTCRIYGADIRRVTKFVEDFAEIGPYMDMPYRTYSAGMRSKIAFGLSMAIGFNFYLIDEGFSVGDASFREKAQRLFQERRANSTLIIIAHSTSIIKKNCDNAIILKDGHFLRFPNLDDALTAYKGICNGRA